MGTVKLCCCPEAERGYILHCTACNALALYMASSDVLNVHLQAGRIYCQSRRGLFLCCFLLLYTCDVLLTASCDSRNAERSKEMPRIVSSYLCYCISLVVFGLPRQQFFLATALFLGMTITASTPSHRVLPLYDLVVNGLLSNHSIQCWRGCNVGVIYTKVLALYNLADQSVSSSWGTTAPIRHSLPLIHRPNTDFMGAQVPDPSPTAVPPCMHGIALPTFPCIHCCN